LNDGRGITAFEAVATGSRRGGVTHLHRRMFPTAGSRQPLLVVMTAVVRNMRNALRIRYVCHDWLTQAAPVADTTSVRWKNDDFCDEQTHVYKSGGRQPAVGIANAGAVALVCHGRLTPTALVLRCERLSAKNNFCDEQTHVHKSGGREPAVVSETRLRWSCESYPETNTIEHSDRQPAVVFRTASASAMR
jgi:hypothetical protein